MENTSILEVKHSVDGTAVYVKGEFHGYVTGDGTGNYVAYIDPRNPSFGHKCFIDAVSYVYKDAVKSW